MANSENEKSAPKVSKLPLPISDSPLVIDLPDGQKIVIGKMTQGSVIEVATWRGVGRPDSRTSRLMLGVGTGNVNDDSESEDTKPAATGAPTKRKAKGFAGAIATVEDFFKNFSRINWPATFKALLQSIRAKFSGKKKITAPIENQIPSPVPSVTISSVSDDAEIEAWLNKITEKAARETAKPRAQAGKAPVKKAAVTKKAAPKSANKRK